MIQRYTFCVYPILRRVTHLFAHVSFAKKIAVRFHNIKYLRHIQKRKRKESPNFAVETITKVEIGFIIIAVR